MLLGLSVTSRRLKKFRDEILLLSLSITRQILGEKIRTKNFVVGSVCHTSARHPATLEWPQILITYNFRAMLCSKKTRLLTRYFPSLQKALAQWLLPPSFGDWGDCACSQLSNRVLGTIKFRLFLTPSMFGVKTCKVMIASLSITSVRGNNMIARLTVMMASTARSY